ncbi:MAG TPA: hypothetical protein VK507_18775 [Iamia sp.]|nr:hypothetical protein [Iamia sp.]
MRKPVIALLLVAIAGVAGFGVWANHEETPRFCLAGAYIMGTVPGLEGYSVTLQDSGTPGPDHCDGPDRPGTYEPDPDESPLPPPSSTEVPVGSVVVDEPVAEPLVLGLDCQYRDGDGEVVATAIPNRPDGECGLPGPTGRQPGELAGPALRPPR